MDRDLKLNSIDRYVKSSPRFVLEEHGHCEVPAGCGGVVLRWRDPRTSVPVRLNMALIGAAERSAAIDGASPASNRPLLVPGKHVFTIHAVAETDATVLVLFSAQADYPPNDPWLLLSRRAERWR